MTASQMVRVLFGATFALAVAASTLAANDDAVPEHPTFSRDVLPIMQRSCQTCHRPNMFTPMSLLTYDEVRPWARSIKQRVEARIMPPWFADRTVGVYRDDPSLSETEIATVARWVDQGAPRGDAADAPAPREWPAVDDWYHGEEPDLVITSPPVVVPPNSTETFPEPELPTGLTEDRYIKWIQVMPGESQVVHHVLIYAVMGGADAETPGAGGGGCGNCSPIAPAGTSPATTSKTGMRDYCGRMISSGSSSTIYLTTSRASSTRRGLASNCIRRGMCPGMSSRRRPSRTGT